MDCETSRKDIEHLLVFQAGTDCPVNRVMLLMQGAAALACGKDVLCREGLPQIACIARDISEGNAQVEDIDMMRELAGVIAENAGCEMSRVAASFCLALIDENIELWEKHILRKLCPAGVCTALSATVVNSQGGDAPRRKRRGRD